MTVRRQLRLARWVIFAACAAGIFVVARHTNIALAWLCAVLVLGAARPSLRFANRLIARRAFARLRALVRTERFAQARALLAELRHIYTHSASALELLRLQEATVLSLERRFPDALRLYESLDLQRIQPSTLPWMLNNFAWVVAQMGDGPRAVALARESIDANANAGDRVSEADWLRACQLGTLGAALVVSGQPAEAVDFLERALVRGGTPREQTVREFYLGEALQSLARHDEARAAWKRAVEASPDDAYGRRARQSLDAPAPPYRS